MHKVRIQQDLTLALMQQEYLCKKLDKFFYVLKIIRGIWISVSQLCPIILQYGVPMWGNSIELLRILRAQK